jgi:hypothetical protein
VNLREVTKFEVEMDHQIQEEKKQRSVHSEEGVSDGNKGGGHNVDEARSCEKEMTRGHSRGHMGEESSMRLLLTYSCR